MPEVVLGQNIYLKPMTFRDISDRIKWFNIENSWQLIENPNAEIKEVVPWKYFCKQIKAIVIKKKKVNGIWYAMEIYTKDKVHIGFLNCFPITLNSYNLTMALGLILPSENNRNHGFGTEALNVYINYLKNNGIKSFCWIVNSKNTISKHIAEKCGFKKWFYNESTDEMYYVKKEELAC